MRKSTPIGASSPVSPILNGPYQEPLLHDATTTDGNLDYQDRGSSALAASTAKAKAERTLKPELDNRAFEHVYGFVSHPVPAARGVSQFGEESTKVVVL